MRVRGLEEYTCRLDVSSRIGSERDHAVGVGCCLKCSGAFIDRLGEPARRGTAALGHDEPPVEARTGGSDCEKNGVLVPGVFNATNKLDRRGEKTKEPRT